MEKHREMLTTGDGLFDKLFYGYILKWLVI